MPLNIKELTGGEVKGAGLYDELMRTSKAHLTEEYDAGRVTGADYGTVYLGVMQSNLQAATQYLLQYELTNQQLLLVQEQVAQAKKQNELLELQKSQLVIANATANYNLSVMLPEQKLQVVAQTALVTQQKAQSVAQVTLVGKQVIQATAQTDLVGKQEDLVAEQILEVKDALLATPVSGLNLAKVNKAEAEVRLLGQRKTTEQAQTEGVVTDTNGVLTNTIDGILGKQMELIYTQRQGFLRDAEQKTAKIFADAFNVAHSITPDLNLPDAYRLGPNQAELIMEKLAGGINVDIPTATPTP